MTDLDPTSLLRRVAEDVAESTAPVARLVAAGRRAHRRRQRALLSAGSAGVVAVAMLGVVLARSQPAAQPAPTSSASSSASGAAPGASPPSGMSFDEAFAWARRLPRGPDAQVAFVADHTLVVGSTRVDLGARTGAHLLGVLPGGWFAREWTDDDGNEIDSRIGLLAADGSFRAFDSPPQRHPAFIGGGGVSPDGTQVTDDAQLIDVATGHVLSQEFPHGARSVAGWTDAGIEYSSFAAGGPPTVWDPATGDVRTVPGFSDFVWPDLLVAHGSHCSTYTRLGDVGSLGALTTRVRLCGDPIVDATSAGGRLVTSHGRVLDPTGAQLADLDLPVPPPVNGVIYAPGPAYVFEDDDTLLVTLSAGPAIRPRSVTVRCRVAVTAPAGVGCERTDTLGGGQGLGIFPLDG